MTPKDWQIVRVVKVVDGDTVAFEVSRVLDDDGEREIFERVRSMKVRLVTLDTPERGEVGWPEARADVAYWLSVGGPLRVETYGRDAFGRHLGDVYVTGDRGDTLTQHMLTVGGWEAWDPRTLPDET